MALDVEVPLFELAVRYAVEAGLEAAAILDATGKPLAIAGALDGDEARAIVAHATHFADADLRAPLWRGEMLGAQFGERLASVGIAARSLIYLIVYRPDTPKQVLAAGDELRDDIERMVRNAQQPREQPPPTGSGGSSSGPAELPVVEIGITVPRKGRN